MCVVESDSLPVCIVESDSLPVCVVESDKCPARAAATSPGAAVSSLVLIIVVLHVAAFVVISKAGLCVLVALMVFSSRGDCCNGVGRRRCEERNDEWESSSSISASLSSSDEPSIEWKPIDVEETWEVEAEEEELEMNTGDAAPVFLLPRRIPP